MSKNNTIRGVFFDFDGLILATEEPIFQAVQELYRSFDQELTLSDWAEVIGLSPDEHDPLLDLEVLVGEKLEREKLESQLNRRMEALISEQDVLPGVVDYLKCAHESGLKLAIVSSSPRAWVHGHLQRLNLMSFFDIICTSDDVERAKPDPALYELALKSLELEPGQVLVFEDSPLGVLAAKRANLFCVAVPTELTKQLSLEHADLQLDSLADISFQTLLAKIHHN